MINHSELNVQTYMSYPANKQAIQAKHHCSLPENLGGGGNGRKEAKENRSVKKTGKPYYDQSIN